MPTYSGLVEYVYGQAEQDTDFGLSPYLTFNVVVSYTGNIPPSRHLRLPDQPRRERDDQAVGRISS